MWVLFVVPCPTSDGQTAEDLYRKREVWISDEMRASARELGCRFHRAWHAEDGSAFYAVANWESREGAQEFFERWDIADEPGEMAIRLLGDVGLVPESSSSRIGCRRRVTMGAGAGVFVLKASSGEWGPDPEVPGSEMQELVHADGLWAGRTRFTSVEGPVTWTPEQREVALVLEGSVRIQIADGPTLELGVGDSFSLAPGVETTWDITVPFEEMWVLASGAS